MTVIVSKPAFNLRSKLTELEYGTIPYNKMPAGSVIQYVTPPHGWVNSRFTTASTSYVNTGYHIKITPRRADSKILIYGNFSIHNNNSSYTYARIFNATRSRYVERDIQSGTHHSGMYESAVGGDTTWWQMPIEAIDVPGSTLQQNYQVWGRTGNGNSTSYWGWSSSSADTHNFNFISAMEIAT
tara:strand:- start:96 stop:647 length:552 start_codon:yes stop_codon:yes gene_type:complete